jgi:small subunit ribosomal protein S3
VTGARSRVEKFNRGYIKHNGEPAAEIVDEGQGVAVMKLGTIGVTVKIIPPEAELPDDFEIREGVEIEAVEQAAETGSGVEELLDEPVEADADDEPPEFADEAVETPTEEPDVEVDLDVEEEVVESEAPEATADDEPDDADGDETEVVEPADETDEELDEDVESEAADLVAEMESAEEDDS